MAWLATLFLFLAAAIAQDERPEHPRLAEATELHESALAAERDGDLETARAYVREAVEMLVEPVEDDHRVGRMIEQLAGVGMRLGTADAVLQGCEWNRKVVESRDDPSAEGLVLVWGRCAAARQAVGDLAGALELQEKAVELGAREMAPSEGNLLAVRIGLATTLSELGEYERATEVLARTWEDCEPHFPEGHPARIAILANQARLANVNGDYETAREMEQRLVDVLDRTTHEDDPRRYKLRNNLALTLMKFGEYAESEALLREVLAYRERTLPEGHREIAMVLNSLGNVLSFLERREEALLLYERACADLQATLPPNHPDRCLVEGSLGKVLVDHGRYDEALPLLQGALEVLEASRDEHDPYVRNVRNSLAVLLMHQKDFAGARPVLERMREYLEANRGEDDPELNSTRANLSIACMGMGDTVAGRVLIERVVASRKRTRPPGDPLVVSAQEHLALALDLMGETEASLELLESVDRELVAAGLDEDSLAVSRLRQNLGAKLAKLGQHERAREMLEQVLDARLRLHSPDHPRVAVSRSILAGVLVRMGEFDAARGLLEQAIEVRERTLQEHHDILDDNRSQLAWAMLRSGEEDGLEPLVGLLFEGVRVRLTRALFLSPREAREIARNETARIEDLLYFSERSGDADLARQAFELLELQRHVSTATLSRLADEGDELTALRREARRLRGQLNDRAAAGAGADEISSLVFERDRVESEIRAALLGNGAELGVVGPEEIAERLAPDEVVVAYRRYGRISAEPGTGKAPEATGAWLAHLVHPDGRLQRLELGNADEIDARIASWREAVGQPLGVARGVGLATASSVKSTGLDVAAEELRAAILDPVLEAARGEETSSKLVVCLDDALHLVPLDALPLDDHLVGDRHALRPVVSLPAWLRSGAPLDSDPKLVALGGVRFDAQAAGPPPDASAPLAAVLERGGRAFTPLPGTRSEVLELAELYREAFGSEARVLTDEEATKAALVAAVPEARFLHLATHGYFAADEADGELGRQTDLFDTDLARARALAPMTLCGLALAGANKGVDPAGRTPGILTAEELAGLDLSRCELAVLSACETNVGLRRAGQGVQSLQAAVHAAGARAAITSLWKVGDESTRELMAGFYARLWIDGLPKAEALWQAKRELRESGAPARDWAGWVLTGE